LEDTLDGLSLLKESLLETGDVNVIEKCARDSQQALSKWLALVPDDDIVAVDSLIQQVRGADQDRDGKLNKFELGRLS